MNTHAMIGGALTMAVGAVLILPSTEARQDAPPAPPVAENQRNTLSYGVGYYLGREVRQGLRLDEIEANLELLRDGFADGVSEADPDLPRDELDEILFIVHEEMQARMVKRLLAEDEGFRELYDNNRETSRALLERHAQEQGVITLTSGVQYRPIKKGTGRSPGLDDVVVVSYRGTLSDGSLINEGREVEIPVRTVIEGGTQVLLMMREGDKWEVVLPPELAYGEAGDPPIVGPNQALLIEVEMHAIK